MDWAVVKAKIHVVAIVVKIKYGEEFSRKRCYKPYQEWKDKLADLLLPGAIKTIPVTDRFWYELGNKQPKLSYSYYPDLWGNLFVLRPSHTIQVRVAVRLARGLYEEGQKRKVRRQFVSRLCQEEAIRQNWYRELISEIRPE